MSECDNNNDNDSNNHNDNDGGDYESNDDDDNFEVETVSMPADSHSSFIHLTNSLGGNQALFFLIVPF